MSLFLNHYLHGFKISDAIELTSGNIYARIMIELVIVFFCDLRQVYAVANETLDGLRQHSDSDPNLCSRSWPDKARNRGGNGTKVND